MAHRDELLSFYTCLYVRNIFSECCADINTVDDYLGINAT